jgi:cardiolipin synthase C
MTSSTVPWQRPAPFPSWLLVWRCLIGILLATAAVGCASLPANTGRIRSTAFAQPDQSALGQLIADRRNRERARNDSGFRLLAGDDEAFSGRLALIQAAQHTLDLQYYAIHADQSTEVLLQGLRDAARRGVRVRILMDDFNTVGKDAQVLRLAFEPNVQIRLFNPLPGSRRTLIGRIVTSLHDFDRVQKRMHNKLFIADNAVGITGGRNLGDAYFGNDEKSNFVDTDVLAAGRIVRELSASFDRFWNDELAYPMHSLVTAQQLEELRKPPAPSAPEPAQAPAAVPVAMPVPSPTGSVLPSVASTSAATPERRPMDLRQVPLVWAPAAVLADAPGKIGPDDDEANAGETVVDGLLTLMRQSRQDVLIVSPYFVPGPAMMNVFRELHAKGVRVRVLTNSLASNDAPAAHAGYARYRKKLLEEGVELYEMRSAQEGPGGIGSTPLPGSGGGGSKSGASRASLHTKAVVIDGRLSVIGSMNLDLRSQRKNSEVALLVRSARLAGDATRQVESTLAHGSYHVQLQHGRSLLWRAPPGAGFSDSHSEPDASPKLRMLVRLIAPFAPDEML